MFEKALRFWLRPTTWMHSVLPAAFLSFLPFIGAFYVVGYSVAVLRASMHGEEDPPHWRPVRKRLYDGFRVGLALVCAMAPFALLIGLGGWLLAHVSGHARLLDQASVASALASILVPIVVAFVVPPCAIAFARTNRIRSVFDLHAHVRLIQRAGLSYLAIVMLTVLVTSVGAIVANLMVLPVVLSDPTSIDVVPRQAIVPTRPDNPLFYVVSSIFGAFWSYCEAFLAGQLALEAEQQSEPAAEPVRSTPLTSDAV